jgi:hypothetical protein
LTMGSATSPPEKVRGCVPPSECGLWHAIEARPRDPTIEPGQPPAAPAEVEACRRGAVAKHGYMPGEKPRRASYAGRTLEIGASWTERGAPRLDAGCRRPFRGKTASDRWLRPSECAGWHAGLRGEGSVVWTRNLYLPRHPMGLSMSTPPHGRRPAAVVVPSRLRSLTSTIIAGPIHQPPTPSLMHAHSITCMCPDGADVPIRLGLSVPIHSGRHSDT